MKTVLFAVGLITLQWLAPLPATARLIDRNISVHSPDHAVFIGQRPGAHLENSTSRTFSDGSLDQAIVYHCLRWQEEIQTIKLENNRRKPPAETFQLSFR